MDQNQPIMSASDDEGGSIDHCMEILSVTLGCARLWPRVERREFDESDVVSV